MRPLDRIDCEILTHLQNNARLSNKELAAKVGVAQSTCLDRVKRLIEEKVLLGFHADISPKALGIGIQAMVSIRLSKHTRESVDTLRAFATDLPEVLAVYHMAGANDFLIHVAVRDADALRELAMTAFVNRPEVDHLETALIFEHVSSPQLPIFVELEE